MTDTIYLDLDGVLVDWVGGVLSAFGKDKAEQETLFEHDLFRFWGLSADHYWNEVATSSQWWECLEPLPWAKDLLDLCQKYCNNVLICTSHGRCAHAPTGKHLWVNRVLGLDSKKVINVYDKWRLAYQPRVVLIDDSDHVIEKWAEVARQQPGGYENAIRMPQPWNKARSFVNQRMEYIQRSLCVYAKRHK
jgi:hypothetical protein